VFGAAQLGLFSGQTLNNVVKQYKGNAMEWKVITGYPDYAINSIGQVKSLRFNRILKNSVNNSGYHYVNLMDNKQRKTTAIHKLVLEHFGCPKPFEMAVVDHKDGNKTNNTLDNLEWVSISENTSRAYGNSHKKVLVKELRQQGWTMQKIADHIGMSLGFVQDTVNA